MPGEEYHLGTTDQELERLAYQHQVWQDVTFDLWQEAGFGPGQALLDLGCGPGFATMELARLVTSTGQVVAVDASEKFIDHLNRSATTAGIENISTQTRDVARLDLPDSSVDGVFIRWLLCFVDNPLSVIQECYRVLKPGGRLVAWDYFNYSAVGLFPESKATDTLFKAYKESAVANKGSYDIGNILPQLLQDASFELTSLQPICRIARPGSRIWHWATLFHQSYVGKLVEQGLLSSRDAEAFFDDWRRQGSNPAAFFMPPPMLGVIARKAG